MKKKSVINDMFNGIRGQFDTMFVKGQNKDLLDETLRIEGQLKQRLTPELFKLHEDYTEALSSRFLDEVDFFFAEGFKLGLLVGIECAED